MAGDWIKMEVNLHEKPEVIAISEALEMNSDEVVGKLKRVWGWFDAQTKNGSAPVALVFIDRLICAPGFAKEMENVRWLRVKDDQIIMPGFHVHTSASAKKRALSARRAAKARKRSRSANGVTKSAAREEKRREEKSKKKSKKSKKKKPPTPLEFPAVLDTKEFRAAWKNWVRYRKGMKKPLQPMTAEAQLRRCAKLGHDAAIAMIENTIEKSWQGLQEPDSGSNSKGKSDGRNKRYDSATHTPGGPKGSF